MIIMIIMIIINNCKRQLLRYLSIWLLYKKVSCIKKYPPKFLFYEESLSLFVIAVEM